MHSSNNRLTIVKDNGRPSRGYYWEYIPPQRTYKCKVCHGTGRSTGGPCSSCEGDGFYYDDDLEKFERHRVYNERGESFVAYPKDFVFEQLGDAARIRHIPTGLSSTCSRHFGINLNKRDAYEDLLIRIAVYMGL